VRDGERYAGHHLLIDLWGAKRLTDKAHIERTLCAVSAAAGATLLGIDLHQFGGNGGISGVALLAESHISIHTWPETGFAAIDVFLCGNTNPDKAAPVLVEAFDIEQQMRAGNLDGASETGGLSWALYAKNIPGVTLIDPRIGPYGAGHMIMNKEKFDGLPADLRKMLADMRYEWTVLATRWVAMDAARTMKTIEENNYPLVRFTDEQFSAWREKMKIDDEIATQVEEYEGRGVPAKEAVSRFKAISAILDKTSVYPSVDRVPVVPTYN